jgi:hypothetical protein
MTKRQVPPPPACQRCSGPVETDTDLCVLCLCADLGITYRQLDHWSRMGYLRPVRLDRGKGEGSGSPRTWPPGELQIARLMGRLTAASAAETAYEQAVRQRWRALVLIVKAKLEAIEAGIGTIETEFLSSVMLPNGSTVGEWVAPQLIAVYGRGEMPALMPGGSGA